jgi:hypothetical protein
MSEAILKCLCIDGLALDDIHLLVLRSGMIQPEDLVLVVAFGSRFA